jgi:hypothetical protein
VLSSCLLKISENAQSTVEIQFTNTVTLRDGIRVVEGAVNVQCESVGMTTIILHSSMHSTISLRVRTGCTELAF